MPVSVLNSDLVSVSNSVHQPKVIQMTTLSSHRDYNSHPAVRINQNANIAICSIDLGRGQLLWAPTWPGHSPNGQDRRPSRANYRCRGPPPDNQAQRWTPAFLARCQIPINGPPKTAEVGGKSSKGHQAGFG